MKQDGGVQLTLVKDRGGGRAATRREEREVGGGAGW